MQQTNGFRERQGLGRLATDRSLTRTAELYACELARTGRFSHTGANGSTISSRVGQQRYRFSFVAENLAWGQRSSREAMTGWINSPGHRRNLVAGAATEIGVGVTPTARGPMWVMVLGRPR
ncbi:MAG: CAP domain-containing protein [Pseudomonadota bacterium]